MGLYCGKRKKSGSLIQFWDLFFINIKTIKTMVKQNSREEEHGNSGLC